MAASVVPALTAALRATADSVVPGAVRTDYGADVSADPRDYFMVGIDDPDSAASGWVTSATTTQDWANANNTARDEEGDIPIVIKASVGDAGSAGMQTAAETAFGYLEDFAAALRANYSQGIPTILWTSLTAAELEQLQDANGSAARIRISVHFKARI